MRLIGFAIRHFLPLGLIAAMGAILFSSIKAPETTRIEGFGLDMSAMGDLALDNIEEQVAMVASTGVKYIRVDLNWTEIESSVDIYDWSASAPLDLLVSSAAANKIKVVAVLKGGPVYLAIPGQPLDREAFGQRWEQFVRVAAEHFGESINIWEIGSAVNSSRGLSTFLSPLSPESITGADPAFYAKLLQSASKIIKEVDPADQVWMGSLTGMAANDCLVNPLTFMLEVNAAKAWKYADAVLYTPRQGASSPEAQATGLNSSLCASALINSPVSLSAEVQAIQELTRQLGDKPVIITSLDWKNTDLKTLAVGRSITNRELKINLLARASTILFGQNNIHLIFINTNLTNNPAGKNMLTNLQQQFENAKPLGQSQILDGTVNDYRFRRGSNIAGIAWRSLDGDTPYPVNLNTSDFSAIELFPVTAITSSETQIPFTASAPGQITVMLSENPILIIGKSGNLAQAAQAAISDQVEIWRGELNSIVRGWVMQAKGALLNLVASWFDQLKQDAVDWGEGLIVDILQ